MGKASRFYLVTVLVCSKRARRLAVENEAMARFIERSSHDA